MRHTLPAVLLSVALGGCAAMTEHEIGVADGRLKPCGAWPRCVSSNDPDKHVDRIRLAVPARAAWPRVADTVAGMPRTRIVARTDTYLHAEVDSPWGWYIDDLELLIVGERELDVRSTGRIGYYDFQVNRERVEALRRALVDQGLALGP